MTKLAGADKELLINALAGAYTDYASFEYLLGTKLDRSLARYAAPGPLDHVFFTVIGKAESEGWIDQLITGAALGNPGNPALRSLIAGGRLDHAIAVRTALREPTGSVQELLPNAAILRDDAVATLQDVIDITVGFQDVVVYATKLVQVAARVCCIEVVTAGRRSSGTGFLIAPDLVLTNHHVLAAQIAQPQRPPGVRCVFDYRIEPDGTTGFGTPVGLAASWLVAASPPSEVDEDLTLTRLPTADQLDYALIRLDSPIGAHAMPDGAARGWFDLLSPAPPVAPGLPVLILQHPGTNPIKLAVDTNGVLEVNGNGTRITYGVNTLPGSSGAPCCTFGMELVALHHAGSKGLAAKRNQGVPIAAIARHLRDDSAALLGDLEGLR